MLSRTYTLLTCRTYLLTYLLTPLLVVVIHQEWELTIERQRSRSTRPLEYRLTLAAGGYQSDAYDNPTWLSLSRDHGTLEEAHQYVIRYSLLAAD